MKRVGCWIVAGFGLFMAVCFVCVVMVCAGLVWPIEFAVSLLFGWLLFPSVTRPEMTVEPTAVVVGGASLVLLVAIAHGLSRWLYGHACRDKMPQPVWRWRWTLAIVEIVVLLFGTSICLIVVVHQVAWLANAKEPVLTYSIEFEGFQSDDSASNLRQTGWGADKYEQVQHHFPPGGTFDEYGNPLHSWETLLLPYLAGSPRRAKPDMSLPWNDPQNAEHFNVEVHEFLNPGVKGPRQDADGLALSHYAANARVMGADHPLRKEDVTDGLSHTIMAGEVKEKFRPWGDPLNWRDPALGVQKSPDGFGGPWASGDTQFLMMDGSVRDINKDIDPAVLRALATPNGGEPVPDNFDQR